MMTLLIFLALLGLIVFGLERNHRRQRPPRMNGSVNFEDRDIPRARDEVQAIPRDLGRAEMADRPRGGLITPAPGL
jgi:hypothetical protein